MAGGRVHRDSKKHLCSCPQRSGHPCTHARAEANPIHMPLIGGFLTQHATPATKRAVAEARRLAAKRANAAQRSIRARDLVIARLRKRTSVKSSGSHASDQDIIRQFQARGRSQLERHARLANPRRKRRQKVTA